MRIKSTTTKSKQPIQSAQDSRSEAMKYVRCAINALGESAKQGDKSSRDAIANLSVVLFDMQDN